MALTKPRIIELLLITTVPVMFLAEQGVPDLWLVLATCIGGYLSAGGANALNMYIDRDIDALMDRTSQRPLVTGMVSPRECLVFGITLAVVSTALVRPPRQLAVGRLSLGALLFYVVVYTMILKRRTVAEHRLGRHRGLHAGPHRLVRRHELDVLGRRSSSSSSSSSGRRRTTGRCR